MPDSAEHEVAINRISNSGFRKATSFNPYREGGVQTFEDFHGYLVVMSNRQSPFLTWG